jgi:hypothetical protein
MGRANPKGKTPTKRTRLHWRFKEHWSGESASFELGGVRAYVRDMDGDSSYWTITRGKGGPVIAEGECWQANNWENCLQQAQDAFLKIVGDRIKQLRAEASAVPGAA